MPLPFILMGAAITAAGYGAKKGYDGYKDKSEANAIVSSSQEAYEKTKAYFDNINESLSTQLTELGELQLHIGSDFGEFRKIASSLLEKLHQSGQCDLTVDIPKHQLKKIDGLVLSTTAYLGKIVGAGVAGAAAAYAVYGGVMAFAAASTGISIASLSGVAATNATLAAIGGGSLAAGGFGMAGGTLILGGVVAAPIAAIAGWAFASHAEEALENAKKIQVETNEAMFKMDRAAVKLIEIKDYVLRIQQETSRLYEVFSGYFSDLKQMDAFLRNGGNISIIENPLINIIGNGYAVAEVLTDIITTPLFKPKMENGNVVTDENGVIQIETDQDGMQILNRDSIDQTLNDSGSKYPQ